MIMADPASLWDCLGRALVHIEQARHAEDHDEADDELPTRTTCSTCGDVTFAYEQVALDPAADAPPVECPDCVMDRLDAIAHPGEYRIALDPADPWSAQVWPCERATMLRGVA